MSKIWLIGGAAALSVLLLASVAIGLTQSEDTFQAGTPEETVQRYLKAAKAEDVKIAHGLLSRELRENCLIEDFANEVLRNGKDVTESRVTLEDKKELNGSVVVVARVTSIRGSGAFETSESSHIQNYTLVQENGEWRFSHYPWPNYGCRAPFPARPRVEEEAPEPEPIPEPRPTAAPQQ